MRLIIRGSMVHIPFNGSDKKNIERVRRFAKKHCPNWKKTKYIPSRLIKGIRGNSDWWTHPEILVYLK